MTDEEINDLVDKINVELKISTIFPFPMECESEKLFNGIRFYNTAPQGHHRSIGYTQFQLGIIKKQKWVVSGEESFELAIIRNLEMRLSL